MDSRRYMKVRDIRAEFVDLYMNREFITDKSGCKMLEIIAPTFVADEPSIFDQVNLDYIHRETQWYDSMSLNVNDIPGGPPKIWQQVADNDGYINSNYGWCIYSDENYSQFNRVVDELQRNPDSRRAQIIYTRPSMWVDYNHNGRSDFICTDAVQYFIRGGRLHAHVRMRSNDAWAGFRNDRAWQFIVLQRLAEKLGILFGNIIWTAGSLHIYERQFYLVEDFINTGHISG